MDVNRIILLPRTFRYVTLRYVTLPYLTLR